jgi:hypothetical protein
VDDRITISVTRIDAERANPSRNRFISNDHVDHSPDARRLAVVNVKFRVRPSVSAAKVTKVARQTMPQKANPSPSDNAYSGTAVHSAEGSAAAIV